MRNTMMDECRQGYHWIPVEERLPDETGKSYLVTYTTKSGRRYVQKLYYRHENVWEGRYKGDVIAWMPLPEPHRQDIKINRRGAEGMKKRRNEI